jgi:peptide/nickel transport system ATP-binding protein
MPVTQRAESTGSLLEVGGLSAHYNGGEVPAVRNVMLTVRDGECVAVVGESGSGKTTLARCIAGLHPSYQGTLTLGDKRLAPDVRERSSDERRSIQLVYQNPDRSLNPRRSVGDQIARPLYLFALMSGKHVNREVARLLERVRLPVSTATRFPAELSGGEKQRVAIARALAARPLLLLCDEITSSLDVSVQAAVLELLAELRREQALSMLYISHDLGVVATIADRIVVMREGALCEEGVAAQVISFPRAAYTQQLIAASPEVPQLGSPPALAGAEDLQADTPQ